MEYNPFARDIQTNPFPVYRWLRDEAPVYHNAEVGFYALVPLRRRAAGAPRPRDVRVVTRRDHRGLRPGPGPPHHAATSPGTNWHRKLVLAAVHPARHRRPRAEGARHRGRGARRRARPRRDRHRRRVLHPPADDGDRRDARDSHRDSRRPPPHLRPHPRPRRGRRAREHDRRLAAGDDRDDDAPHRDRRRQVQAPRRRHRLDAAERPRSPTTTATRSRSRTSRSRPACSR